MSPRIVAYGPEAQRRLERRKLYAHFHDKKWHPTYISWAAGLMRTIIAGAKKPVIPPRNAFQAVFAQYLESREDFLDTLVKVGEINTAIPQWCGMFAGMVVEEGWDEITKEVAK